MYKQKKKKFELSISFELNLLRQIRINRNNLSKLTCLKNQILDIDLDLKEKILISSQLI